MNIYYVYYYLREKSSGIAEIGTPYYVGLGKNKRIHSTARTTPKPKNINNRIKIAESLTIEEARKIERLHIALWGRIDCGTGILRNMTDGGDGAAGRIISLDERRRRSAIQKEVQNRPEVKEKRKKSMTEANASNITKLKRSESAKRNMQNHELRNNAVANMQNWWKNNPEKATKVARERALKSWNDGEKGEQRREKLKKLFKDPDFLSKRKESFQKTASTKEFAQKKRDCQLGLKFWNNGKINIRAREQPEGFVPGRLSSKN